MSNRLNYKRLNRKSYLLNMLFTVPVLATGRGLANSFAGTPDESLNITTLAMLASLTAAVLMVFWTVYRLHDAGRSGWWSFLLLPPFTILLWAYTFFVPGKDGENKWGKPSTGFSFFGMRMKGAGRIISAMFIAVVMIYLTALFQSFLFM